MHLWGHGMDLLLFSAGLDSNGLTISRCQSHLSRQNAHRTIYDSKILNRISLAVICLIVYVVRGDVRRGCFLATCTSTVLGPCWVGVLSVVTSVLVSSSDVLLASTDLHIIIFYLYL